MDQVIKKKVLDWINTKIIDGKTQFDVELCIQEIGLDPYSKGDYYTVEEVFIWHQSIINEIQDICYEHNT